MVFEVGKAIYSPQFDHVLQVPLRRRFIYLFLALGLCLLGLLALVRYLQQLEAQDLVAAELDRKGALVENWITLKGESLKQFASDYAQWDELVDFVHKPSAEWASVNLDASLKNFHVDGCWVYRLDGSPVYEVFDSSKGRLAALSFADPKFYGMLKKRRFMHFFGYQEGQLLEYRVAPVQTSADIERVGPALGWFVVARVWDAKYTSSLAQLSEGKLELQLARSPEQEGGLGEMVWTKELLGWDDSRVLWLRVQFSSTSLMLGVAHDQVQLILFACFGFVVLGIFGYFNRLWILHPLRQISVAMAKGSPEPLGVVLKDPSEVGQLARLAEDSFRQKSLLEKEVAERQRMETALRLSEASLRQSLRTRTELGRNLHDGVIQSLYASGMAMTTVTHLIRTDPDEAIKELQETRGLLNEVIRDVRDFITGLEPETLSSLSFADALGKIFEQMSNLRDCDFSMHVPERLVVRLDPQVRLQLLQIFREAVSNALRHGKASKLSCLLSERSDGLLFEVCDNGGGFDPAGATTGLGLKNLAERAASCGAELTIDSSHGWGTDLRVFIPGNPGQ